MINKAKEYNIKQPLILKSETLAVAESVTGGLLQYSFAMMEDTMKFFQGGITAYNIGQKVKHLRIDPIHAQSCNCVSERIAGDMALNVCKLFHSNYGIAITGYSSPVPESGNLVYAFFAIARNGNIEVSKRITAEGNPAEVNESYVKEIFESLEKVVGK